MIAFMAVPAASRAALTVVLLTVIPTPTRATSGTSVTEPVAETVMTCGMVPSVAGRTDDRAGSDSEGGDGDDKRAERQCAGGPDGLRHGWVPFVSRRVGRGGGGVSPETVGTGREFPRRGGDPWVPSVSPDTQESCNGRSQRAEDAAMGRRS